MVSTAFENGDKMDDILAKFADDDHDTDDIIKAVDLMRKR